MTMAPAVSPLAPSNFPDMPDIAGVRLWTAAAGHLQALPGTVVPEQFTGRDTAPAWLDVERVMAADTGRDQAALLISLARSELEATKYAYSLPGGATF